ncbi:MAG: serine hydrolase domain-containing protein [Bacteroidota bacterium]
MNQIKAITLRLLEFCTLLLVLSMPSACNETANSADNTAAEKPASDPALDAFLTDYRTFFLETMAATRTPGAAIVIVRGDSIVWMEGFGIRQTGSSDSVDINTVFRVGSLSKGFAGVLTGILVQEGWIGWNEHVRDCYPEFTLSDEAQAQRVQLRHLLSHTTGLPYHAFTHLIERGYDTRKIVSEYFPHARLSAREGEYYSYQNAAFSVIEEVMEAATQQPYQELLREKIFIPAGMKNASCDYLSMASCQNKCLPHFQTGFGFRADSISSLYYNSAAAGGVNASISDMGEWLKLLLGHRDRIVADSTLDRVFEPVIGTGGERSVLRHWVRRNDAYYALGWRILQHDTDTIIYHGGYVNGFRGEIAFNRRDDVGICVLMNASTELGTLAVTSFFDRWKYFIPMK